MAQAFNPYLRKGTTNILLPQPIASLNLSPEFKSDVHSLPTSDGGVSYGHSTGTLSISIEGEMYKTSDENFSPEDDAFDGWNAIYTFLRDVDEDNPCKLVIYNDSISYYRWIDKVYPVSFNCDIGDQAGDGDFHWPYTLVLRADDPVIKTTNPHA